MMTKQHDSWSIEDLNKLNLGMPINYSVLKAPWQFIATKQMRFPTIAGKSKVIWPNRKRDNFIWNNYSGQLEYYYRL